MTIGNNIKKLRTAQGLTQDQLAERLFVTRQTISSWERSASHPSLEQLEAPSRGLGHAAKTGVAVLCDCISADRGSVAGLWHRGIGFSALATGLKREGKAAVFDRSAGVFAGQSGPFCLDSPGALPLPHLCVLDVQL